MEKLPTIPHSHANIEKSALSDVNGIHIIPVFHLCRGHFCNRNNFRFTYLLFEKHNAKNVISAALSVFLTNFPSMTRNGLIHFLDWVKSLFVSLTIKINTISCVRE